MPKVTQNRIARLAQASGRSPAATLRFVLRDGFDAVERSIQENANADAEFAAGATATHAGVRSYPVPKTGHSFDYRVVKGEIRIQRWYRQRQQLFVGEL